MKRMVSAAVLAGLLCFVGCGGSSDSNNDPAPEWGANWQLRLLGNYGGPNIRMRSDVDVFVDMSYAGRPEAQVTSGVLAEDGTIAITVTFPDDISYTGVFNNGTITWENGTTWTQDRAWQDEAIGTYAGPAIQRRSDGFLEVDMSSFDRPNAQVWTGYANADGSIRLVVFFPDELTHEGTLVAGVISWDNGTSWTKDL